MSKTPQPAFPKERVGQNKKRNTSSLGKIGEERAAAAIEAAGMKVIEMNFRSKFGEIDVIAVHDETIIFIEVKTWSSFNIDNLQYSIDEKKQRKIIKTAKYFLCENRKYSNMSIRFDVIFVKENQVNHLASAFTESV